MVTGALSILSSATRMRFMPDSILARLDAALEARRDRDPGSSYVAGLLAGGRDAIVAKIREEADEVIEAADSDDDAHLIHEIADLWFHTIVLLIHRRLSSDAVLAELGRRFGVSGLAEKAARDDHQQSR